MAARTLAEGSRERTASGREPAVYAAAVLSLVAALVHLWAAPEHFEAWWGYGSFFIATALAQGCFAVAVLRWQNDPLCLAGILGNLAVVGMYVFTRTSGIPFGPQAAMIEDAGLLDMAATVAEVGVVLALVAMLGEVWRRRTINALFLLGVAVWVLKFTGVLF